MGECCVLLRLRVARIALRHDMTHIEEIMSRFVVMGVFGALAGILVFYYDS